MKDLLTKLFEAHIEHELNAIKNGAYKRIVKEEVSALFRWINHIKLKDIVTQDQIIDLIQQKVVESPVPGGITELTGEMSRKVLTSIHNDNTLFEDIFTRKQFDTIMDIGINLKKVRTYLIKKILYSSAYSKLISTIIYIAIKEYLITESKIAQKIPGISSILDIGKHTVNLVESLPVVSSVITVCKESINHALPNFEAEIENRITTYIETTLDSKIKHSENILLELLNEKKLDCFD